MGRMFVHTRLTNTLFYVVDKNQKHLGALSTQADNTVDELDRMPIYIN